MTELLQYKFPKGFLWGSATSAHQVEGNNTLNDWYRWEEAGKIKNGERSGLACDHYNHFREDIDLLVSLSQNAYRFSIEWSRIEPRPGEINRAELEHYRKVLEYLRARGVKSFVTLHHFTSPLWFDWEGAMSVEYFARFSELIAKELGHLVDFWCTVNEPNILAKHGYLEGDFPPGRRDVGSFFRVLNNLIHGHNASYNAIHSVLPHALVGMAKDNTYYIEAPGRLDRLVTLLNHEIRNRYFLDRTKFDFIGLNYYGSKKLRFDCASPQSFYASKVKLGLPTTDMGWEIVPWGLSHVISDLCGFGKPIYITENGIADAGDSKRKEFIKQHLKVIHQAISVGTDIRGYFYWSLLDNFEWGFGFGPRFGLVAVDYSTGERRVRDSAGWYAEVCRNNFFEK